MDIQGTMEQQRERILRDNGLTYDEKYSKLIQVDNNTIGFYTPRIILDRLMVEYNLFEEYRNQGLGVSFVKMVTEAVGREYTQFDTIYLLIHFKNIPSLTVAVKNGYMLCYEEDLQESICEEMPNYQPYCKHNEFYHKPLQKEFQLHKL